ncbi:MAG: hypothetical protein U9P90_04285 [Patescibacteria group bacterium]|nr:hypothetical protein [Patescibacteria group bacterium]
MTFTYSLLLIPYALFLVVFALFVIINLFNLTRFGGWTIITFWATFLFLAGIVLIAYASYENLIIFDWHQTITISNNYDLR